MVDLPLLDGSFAVFDNVIDGLDVVIGGVELGDSITAARVTQGIVPNRVSQIITDTILFNDFINTVDRGNIPLPIDFFKS